MKKNMRLATFLLCLFSLSLRARVNSEPQGETILKTQIYKIAEENQAEAKKLKLKKSN